MKVGDLIIYRGLKIEYWGDIGIIVRLGKQDARWRYLVVFPSRKAEPFGLSRRYFQPYSEVDHESR